MNDPEVCEHDWRRVYPADIMREIDPTKPSFVVAVLCCRCGKSPLWVLTTTMVRQGAEEMLGIPDTTPANDASGDWPASLRITAYYWDEAEGPSVEFQ